MALTWPMARSKVTLVLARKQVKKKQKYFFHTMYEHSTCWHLNCQLSHDHDPIQVRQQKQNTKTKQKTETTTCFVFFTFLLFFISVWCCWLVNYIWLFFFGCQYVRNWLTFQILVRFDLFFALFCSCFRLFSFSSGDCFSLFYVLLSFQ